MFAARRRERAEAAERALERDLEATGVPNGSERANSASVRPRSFGRAPPPPPEEDEAAPLCVRTD